MEIENVSDYKAAIVCLAKEIEALDREIKVLEEDDMEIRGGQGNIDQLKRELERLSVKINDLESLKNRKNRPSTEITSYDGKWGSWHDEVRCPDGHYVCGLRARFEHCNDCDDTGLNAVRLKCCPFFP